MRELNFILDILFLFAFTTVCLLGIWLFQKLNSRAVGLLICTQMERIFRLYRLFWGLLIQIYRAYLQCSNLDGALSYTHYNFQSCLILFLQLLMLFWVFTSHFPIALALAYYIVFFLFQYTKKIFLLFLITSFWNLYQKSSTED